MLCSCKHNFLVSETCSLDNQKPGNCYVDVALLRIIMHYTEKYTNVL